MPGKVKNNTITHSSRACLIMRLLTLINPISTDASNDGIYGFRRRLVINILVFFTPLAVWHANLTAIEVKDFLVLSGLVLINIWNLLAVLRKNSMTFRFPILNLAVLFYLAAITAAFIFNTTRSSINYRAFIPQAAGPILFLSVLTLLKFRHLKGLIWTAVISGSIVSINGILQYFELSPFLWRNHSIGSTLGHKNFLAFYFILVLPWSFWLVFAGKRIVFRVIAGAGLILMSSTFLLSGSKGGLISFGLGVSGITGLFIIKLLFRRSGILIPVVSGSILVLSGAAVLIFSDSLKTAVTYLNGTHEIVVNMPDNQRRIKCFRAASEIIGNHFLAGVGPGNFQFNHPFNHKYKVSMDAPNTLFAHVHNDFLEHWLEYGILPAVFFLCILGWCLFRCAHKFTCSDNKSTAAVNAALFVSLAGAATYLNITTAGRYMSSTFQLWLTLGLAVVASADKDSLSKKFDFPPVFKRKTSQLLILSVAVSLFFLLSARVYANYVSDLFFQQGHRLYRTSTGHFYYNRALALNPRSVEAWYQRGFLLFHEKRYKDALWVYLKADSLAPGYENIAFNLASCYYRLRDWKNAMKQADRSVRMFPDYLPALRMSAFCKYYLGDAYSAQKKCRQILEKWPFDEKMLKLQQNLERIPGLESEY